MLVGAAAIAGRRFELQYRLASFGNIGGAIGTLVSAFFLFAIALINLIVLRSIYRAFVRVRRGEPYVEEDFNLLLGDRDFWRGCFAPSFG